MKTPTLTLPALAAMLALTCAHAAEKPEPALEAETHKTDYTIFKKWDFYKKDDNLGWTTTKASLGAVIGGSLWIKFNPENLIEVVNAGNCLPPGWKPDALLSPEKVGLSVEKAKRLRLRVCNLSSDTKGFVTFTTTGDSGKEIGPIPFLMKAYSKEWQEIVCDLESIPWTGELDRIKLVMGSHGIRGDVYIDWIAVTDGPSASAGVESFGVFTPPETFKPALGNQPKETQRDYKTVLKWEFDKVGDTDGWSIPKMLLGSAVGDALWIKCFSEKAALRTHSGLGINFKQTNFLMSPDKLGIKATDARKLRMRLLNLSSETDGKVYFSSSMNPSKMIGSIPFSMKPYSDEWQEIVCHLDDDVSWTGEISQLSIVMGLQGMRGDIYLDWIALTDGPPRMKPEKPDVCSTEIIPQLSLPGVTQADFAEAFKVIDVAMVYDNLPLYGFSYPHSSPGGAWPKQWWLNDTTLPLPALKWVNLGFCENVMRGFIEVQSQNPDGRIGAEARDGYGGGPGDLTQQPDCYFVVGHDVFKSTRDTRLKEQIYQSMRSYLDWWMSPVKREAKTGLVLSIFEETFGLHKTYGYRTTAPTDTNVAVCNGASILADMARRLGHAEDQIKYSLLAKELAQSINQFLWNEEMGAYLNYNVIESKHLPHMFSHTFHPFVRQIAPPERQAVLLKKLVDPALFNWGTIPLTTLAKNDSQYIEWKGHYLDKAWSGDIWTLSNMFVIKGLKDIRAYDLAAELNWKTIQMFNGNYHEFLEPQKGEGQGQKGYTWTAAQYVEAIIQNLFGIEFDHSEHRLTIAPLIPEALHGQELSIGNLQLPGGNGNKIQLKINDSPQSTLVELAVSGKIDDETLTLVLPYKGSIEDVSACEKLTDKALPVSLQDGAKQAMIIPLRLTAKQSILVTKGKRK